MNVFSPIIWQTSSWKGKQTLLGMWGLNNTQKRGQQKFPNKRQRKAKKVWSVREGIGRKMEFRILERARFGVFALFNSRADNAKTSDFAFTPSRFLSSKEPQKLCRYSSKLNKKVGWITSDSETKARMSRVKTWSHDLSLFLFTFSFPAFSLYME